LVDGGENLCTPIFDCGENFRTPHGIARVWPKPGKKSHQDVDSSVFVSIHNEPTFFAAIGSFPEWHSLLVPTTTAGFRRITLI
jgi:hypothetical protein